MQTIIHSASKWNLKLQEEKILKKKKKKKESNVSLNLEAATARLLWIIFMHYLDRMTIFIQKYFYAVKEHFSLGIFHSN